MRSKLLKFTASLLAPVLLLGATSARGQVPASTQFDLNGFLQEATVDNAADNLSGGTLQVNGHTVIVPRNVLVLTPAASFTWAQLFQYAPAPYGVPGGAGVTATIPETGMALSDTNGTPSPLTTYELHVVGNRIGNTYIAGMIDISQQGLNGGSGYISYIDYTNAEMRVGGVIGNPNTGARVRINDPAVYEVAGQPGVFKGRFSRGQSPDVRFTLDPENPTIRSETGYPMGLPDVLLDPTLVNPATGVFLNPDDPLRPRHNRPLNGNLAFPLLGFVTVGNPLTQWTMRNPAIPAVHGGDETDPNFEAPFRIGDFVTYAGTLVQDGDPSRGPTTGPMPANGTAGTYISAHTIVASLGIYTAPGTTPAYVAIDVTILGVGGVTPLGLGEATARTRFEGFTTDASRIVDLFGMDVDCSTGGVSDRNWGSIDQDPGAAAGGAVQGRWRFRPPGKVLTMPAAGAFLPATRMVRAVIRGGWTPIGGDPVTGNGLIHGQYQAPILEYLFPENQPGTPVPPNNFDTFPFLARGSGPLPGGLPGEMVAQLSPWPGTPIPPNCGGVLPPPLPPVANAGIPQVKDSQTLVTLDGNSSFDPNGVGLTGYHWTQLSGSNVTLLTPNSVISTFIAPRVQFGQPAIALTFGLVVTSAAGGVSPQSTVTITVNPPATAGTPVANAGTAQTVPSTTAVTLNGSLSSDPNGNVLTYAWTQTAGTAVTLTGANTATPSFTAPTLVPGSPSEVLSFSLTVNNGFNSSLAAITTVTVESTTAQAPVANAGTAQTVASDATVTLNGSTSSDPNGLTLTYAWSQTAGTAVTLASTTSALTTFTAPHVAYNAAAQTLSFRLVVRNAAGLTSTSSVNVAVSPAPLLAPTVTVGAPQTVNSGALVTLTGTGIDPNIPAQNLTYTWTKTAGPNVTLTGANTPNPTFTAPTVAAGNQPAVITFGLVVRNTGNLVAQATTTVTVNPIADAVTITAVEYRTGKSRLTVNVTDSVISPNLVITLTGPSFPATPMQNLGGGLYQLVLVGVTMPASVTATSQLGGSATAASSTFRIRL